MDFLKLIPQVFFDAIGRVVPGMVLIVGLRAITGYDIVGSLLEDVAPPGQLRESVLVWVLIVTTTAYVAGHFLSPFVKYMERERAGLPERPQMGSTMRHKRRTYAARWLWYGAERIIWSVEYAVLPFRRRTGHHETNIWRQYDWLRLEKPEVGGLVARIRAEYTMYGSLAAGFLLLCLVLTVILVNQWRAYSGTLWQFLSTAEGRSTVAQIAVAGVVGELMAIRHEGTYRIFGLSVESFYHVAQGSDRWKEQLLKPLPSPKASGSVQG